MKIKDWLLGSRILHRSEHAAMGVGAPPLSSLSADAAANAAAIQAMLDDGRSVIVNTPGTYYCSALTLPSGADIYLGSGVTLKAPANLNTNMMRNSNWNASDGSGWKSISSLAATHVTAGVLVSVTLAVAPSGELVGTTADMLISGAVPDYYNGVFSVTYTASGFEYYLDITKVGESSFSTPASFDSWTGISASVTNGTATVTINAADSGLTGTAAAGSATLTGVSSTTNVVVGQSVVFTAGSGYPSYAQVVAKTVNTITLNEVMTAAGAVTVSVYPFISPGMTVSITAGSATLGNAVVDRWSNTGQITLLGATPVCSGTQAVTLTASFPLRCCLGNRNIRVWGGGTIDHNQTNQSAADSLLNIAINLRGVGNSYFGGGLKFRDSFAGICVEGAYNNIYENINVVACTRQSGNGLYPVKHSGRSNVIRNITGKSKDDFVSIIGKEYVQYMDAGSPVGVIDDLVIENILPDGCLSIVKILPTPSAQRAMVGSVILNNVRGRNSYAAGIKAPCYDSTNTGDGTNITQTVAMGSASGRISSLIVQNPYSLSKAGPLIQATAAADSIFMSGIQMPGLTSAASVYSVGQYASIRKFRIDSGYVESSVNPVLGTISGIARDISINMDVVGTTTGTSVPGGLVTFAATAPGYSSVSLGGSFSKCGPIVSYSSHMGNTLNLSGVSYSTLSSQFIATTGTCQVALFVNGCQISQGSIISDAATLSNSYGYWDDGAAEQLTGSASTVVNLMRRAKKTVSIGTNTTINNPSNKLAIGDISTATRLTFFMKCTGAYTLSWGAQYKFPTAISGSPSAGAYLAAEFVWNGLDRWTCINAPVWQT